MLYNADKYTKEKIYKQSIFDLENYRDKKIIEVCTYHLSNIIIKLI